MVQLKVHRGPCLNSHLEKRLSIEIPRWSPFSRNIHSCLQSHAILFYAGDFNIITSNKITHERLINELHSITSSKNLTFKPDTCKNLSTCSGSSKIVPFSLGGKHLDSISPVTFFRSMCLISINIHGVFHIHPQQNWNYSQEHWSNTCRPTPRI